MMTIFIQSSSNYFGNKFLRTRTFVHGCSIGPKYVVSERKEFAEMKHSKLKF